MNFLLHSWYFGSIWAFWGSLPFHYHHKLSTLRLHEFFLIVMAAISLLVCYLLEPSLGGTLIIEAVGILTLLFLSSLISWWDIKLQTNDMYTRAQNLLDQIQGTRSLPNLFAFKTDDSLLQGSPALLKKCFKTAPKTCLKKVRS